jgi:hypothetical protein
MTNDDKILQALENIQADVKELKQGQKEQGASIKRLEQGQAQTKTLLKVLEAGQNDVRENINDIRENMATKADVRDIKADQAKQQRRLENLEENTKTPNPHKN